MKQILDNLLALGRLRLAAIAGVAVVLLAGIDFDLRATPPMGLLYAELDARDGGAVIAALDRQRVPYQGAERRQPDHGAGRDVARLRLTWRATACPPGAPSTMSCSTAPSLTTTPSSRT